MTKKKVKESAVLEQEDVFELGNTEGFYDESEPLDADYDTGELRYEVKTLNLPSDDHTLSYLLSKEAMGEITITRKDLFPMKEGFILAYIEYKNLNR